MTKHNNGYTGHLLVAGVAALVASSIVALAGLTLAQDNTTTATPVGDASTSTAVSTTPTSGDAATTTATQPATGTAWQGDQSYGTGWAQPAMGTAQQMQQPQPGGQDMQRCTGQGGEASPPWSCPNGQVWQCWDNHWVCEGRSMQQQPSVGQDQWRQGPQNSGQRIEIHDNIATCFYEGDRWTQDQNCQREAAAQGLIQQHGAADDGSRMGGFQKKCDSRNPPPNNECPNPFCRDDGVWECGQRGGQGMGNMMGDPGRMGGMMGPGRGGQMGPGGFPGMGGPMSCDMFDDVLDEMKSRLMEMDEETKDRWSDMEENMREKASGQVERLQDKIDNTDDQKKIAKYQKQITKIEGKIEKQITKMKARFEKQTAKMKARFEKQIAKLEDKAAECEDNEDEGGDNFGGGRGFDGGGFGGPGGFKGGFPGGPGGGFGGPGGFPGGFGF